MNQTIQEIIDDAKAAGRPAPSFFYEVMNVETGKCLGIVNVSRDWLPAIKDRRIGYSGRVKRTLTEDITVERGPNAVIVRASKRKPVTIYETLFPSSAEPSWEHPLSPKHAE